MNIPKQAKKVFSGIIFDVYHWEQEMYDGSKETFEMLDRPDTVCIIATANNKVYIAHQEQPTKPRFYSLLGGRQDEGEDILDTAKRELLEESGMESDEWKLFKVVEPYFKVDWKVHLFIAKNCKKTAEQNTDAGEKIDIKELSFDNFIDVVINEDFCGKELVEEVLRMKLEPEKMEEFKKKIF